MRNCTITIKKSAIILIFPLLLVFAGFFGIDASAAQKTHLSKTSITLETGETASLKLIGASGKIKWSISDSDVCKYSKGTVTAVGEGTAYITASNCGKKYKCKVTVIEPQIKSDAQFDVPKDQTYVLIIDTDGSSMGVSNSDNDIISVKRSSGKNKLTLYITGKKNGKAYITVYDKSFPSAKVILEINVGGTSEEQSEEAKVSPEEYTDEVIRLVNEERKAAGLSPLEKNDDLCSNAQTRALELGTLFDHTRPDGTDCFTVISVKRFYTAGENIAQGQRTPADVMSSWMSSSGHRGNILNKNFTEIGVGYDPETNSWVQIFIG